MRKALGIITAVGLALVLSAAVAKAQLPIVKDGADYSGIANPHGCVIKREGTDLHVNCVKADGPARIRYRFLADLGVKKGPATFTGRVEHRGGPGRLMQQIRWMADPDAPRTGRVLIPRELYVHIEWVKLKWYQR